MKLTLAHTEYEGKMNDADDILRQVSKLIDMKKREDMEVAREWPPEEYVVKRWVHQGLDCAISAGPLGAFCGYVRVPEGHPDERLHYDDVDVSVHGGLTFRCKAKEGGSWFGFDCAHAGDFVPEVAKIVDNLSNINNKPSKVGDNKVWRQEEVEAETNLLAEQLADRDALSNMPNI